MLSIGTFARLGGVTVRTLRYYEEADLLLPAAVDVATGYRTYEARQLSRLHRIVALKDLGLSLQQLRPLLDEISAEQLRGMLLLKRAELEQQVTATLAVLDQVESRLRSIDQEDDVLHDVIEKRVPELRLADIRIDVEGLDFDTMGPHIEVALTDLYAYITESGLKPVGPLFVLHYDSGPGQAFVPHVAVQAGEQRVTSAGRVTEVVLPATTVLATVHTGAIAPSEIGGRYAQLARWAEERGLGIGEFGREFVLELFPDLGGVVELQLPVERTETR
jgi:DNA-binding transcriptional MerR regulator